MKRVRHWLPVAAALLAVAGTAAALAQEQNFGALVEELQQQKPEFAERHQKLLRERYDLEDNPADGVTMSRGKPVQQGVRVLLPDGVTWEELAGMSPAEIKDANLGPQVLPLPHPHHEAGGMVFPAADR